jgi:hypothetical protein
MQRMSRKLVVIAILAGGFSASIHAVRAADDFKPEEGYTSLFNGKDLTGWRYLGFKESLAGKTETPDKRIQVVDGVIVCNEKDSLGKGGIQQLFTVKDYDKPFHLKLQFRASLKSDSGVYLRASSAQLQVRDYPRFGGQYSQVPGFKLDDWNDLDITVGGKETRLTVNGKQLTDKDEFDLTVRNGKPSAKLNGKVIDVTAYQFSDVAYALCKNNSEVLEKAFPIPLKGGIGLQAETGKFEFRRIRVKELP